MAKQGMKRPEISKNRPKNTQPPVPEVRNQGPYDTDLANDNLYQDIPYADRQDM